ncbi:histidinol-phosphate transaminase [Thiomicrorhabdus lithotrophica]|uniref:Histidinol-phosphate aminotransferase n=1 Tax=Thiomicrorhabdus lithotrophica TaxID=2949997 RepID=A0ABY8CCK5_9GAMM|nr:histidinol-phosphate transaminase [Thiomicrorhabdus lithotrophica]WEJ63714.1 histidinol-phosphate transaminase [Thiomicrorhabdus lithotrophica]
MKPASALFCDQVQPQVLGIHPYIPGKPVSELQRELGLESITKLASNENPLGASPNVITAIQNELVDIARYPDGSAYALKQQLAEFLNIADTQLAIGNGSNEVLELVSRVFAGPGDEIIYSQYAFAVYPISAQVVGATGVEVPAVNWGHDLNAMLAAITTKTKLIYIANPNNPTGTFFTKEQWQHFIDAVPSHIIVVLDEAYLEYAQSFLDKALYFNGVDYVEKYKNLLVSRTFSKAYGLASLRIGYMVGNEETVQYLNQMREPFNVNHYAQVAAQNALQDQAFVEQVVQLNQAGMRQLVNVFDELDIAYISSIGNFICIDLGEKVLEYNQKLLEEGVIVRPIANYGMPQYLRISIGTQVENQYFIDALKKVLQAN